MADTTNNVIPINPPSIKEAISNAIEVVAPSWPDPQPLPCKLSPVPRMEDCGTMLPSCLADHVFDTAERYGVPADYVAIPAMVGLGSIIGAKVGFCPKEDLSWRVPANLWGVTVGGPGTNKSSSLSTAIAPIYQLQNEADRSHRHRQRDYEAEMAVFAMQLKDAEIRAKAELKKEGGSREMAAKIIADVKLDEPTRWPEKRFVADDMTYERMGELMVDNPDGLLVKRDELASLLRDLTDPLKASARGFFLTGWGGTDRYGFERIGRGRIDVPRVNISLIGTTQPDVIAAFIRDSLRINDGFAARLQLLTHPDRPIWTPESSRYENELARKSYQRCFTMLADAKTPDLGAIEGLHGIPYLEADHDALSMLRTFREQLKRECLGDDLHPAILGHFDKYGGLAAKLSLIIHLARKAEGNLFHDDMLMVDGEAVEMALRWMDYLRQHAIRTYNAALNIDSSNAAHAILRRIEKGDIGASFTARDIYTRNWSGLGKGQRLTDGLATLVDYGWLVAEPTGGGRGRPTTIYRVHPSALPKPILLAA